MTCSIHGKKINHGGEATFMKDEHEKRSFDVWSFVGSP